jgi:uroporphyrinogen decarboxylase
MGAVNRTGTDRIPVKHEGTPEIDAMLMAYFGLTNHEQLLRVLGSDFRYVEPVYTGPELRTFPDGSIEGYFGERYKYAEFDGGKYLEPSYLPFEGIDTLDQLDRSHFPTADWFDYSTIRAQCDTFAEQGSSICCGTAGDMDFINSIARCRGTEQVLVDLIEDNEVYLAIMDARFEFFYEQHRRMLEAADGLIDFAHVGDDLGSQTGPMIGPDIFERHFATKYKKYFDMVHSYGAKSKMHMCGCVHSFLPRLIELGLDVYDVVQPTTPEMDIAVLHGKFSNDLIFCGTVCVQSTIAFGTPEDVEHEVKRRLDLFKDGGLFLGPTHAIQVGSPLENILTLYRTAGSMIEKENIGDDILSIQGHTDDEGKINMSKLF